MFGPQAGHWSGNHRRACAAPQKTRSIGLNPNEQPDNNMHILFVNDHLMKKKDISFKLKAPCRTCCDMQLITLK